VISRTGEADLEKSDLPNRHDRDAVTVESLADAVGIAADNEQVFQEASRARQWLEASSDVHDRIVGPP
jgi:hypothetical protein